MSAPAAAPPIATVVAALRSMPVDQLVAALRSMPVDQLLDLFIAGWSGSCAPLGRLAARSRSWPSWEVELDQAPARAVVTRLAAVANAIAVAGLVAPATCAISAADLAAHRDSQTVVARSYIP